MLGEREPIQQVDGIVESEVRQQLPPHQLVNAATPSTRIEGIITWSIHIKYEGLK